MKDCNDCRQLTGGFCHKHRVWNKGAIVQPIYTYLGNDLAEYIAKGVLPQYMTLYFVVQYQKL